MTNFGSFGSDVPPRGFVDGRAVEQAADAIFNGQRLPGKLGLAQEIVEIWASPRFDASRGFHFTKLGFRTAGALWRYRSEQRAREDVEIRNPISDFLEERSLSSIPEVNNLEPLVYAYIEKTQTRLVRFDDASGSLESNNLAVSEHVLPSGLVFFCVMFQQEETKLAQEDRFRRNRTDWALKAGPLIDIAKKDEFLLGLSKLIWSHEGDQDLELYYEEVRPWGDEGTFRLCGFGEPDDYVSKGAEGTKRSADEMAERCRAFQSHGIARKVLLHGPPGTGKTTLARMMARSVGGGRALRVDPTILQRVTVDTVIRLVLLLRPSVFLMDDIDRHQGDCTTLLHFFERAQSLGEDWARGIVIIATANTVRQLDPAMLREGRFDETLLITEPEDAQRVHIVQHYLEKEGVKASAKTLSRKMAGFSGASVHEVIKCLRALGPDGADGEIARVREQRALYEGSAVEDFYARATPGLTKKIGR